VNKIDKIILLIISIVYISLCLKLPVSIYTTANYDDALFWNNASSILRGNWLGDYNDLTLIKGVGFPLFLALNYLIGFPISLSTSVFFLLSIILFLYYLKKYYNINKVILFSILILLLFQPYYLPGRVIRDNIYPALTLLFITGFINLYNFDKFISGKYSISLFGVAGGFLLLTREEGIWVFPALIFLLIFKSIAIFNNKIIFKKFLIQTTIFLFSIYVPIGIVSTINYFKYGQFIATESFIAKGPYTDTLKILNSIESGPEIPHIPVSYAKRSEAYKVSPSFLKLKDYFERDGRWWTQPGCDIYPDTCGDFAGGWFMFALRAAVTRSGYYTSPKDADNFYRQIYIEISDACSKGVISCHATKIPFMPRLTKEQWAEIPGKFIDLIAIALIQGDTLNDAGPSWGPADLLLHTKIFLGNPVFVRPPSEKIAELSGWYYSNKGSWIALQCQNALGKPEITQISRIYSPGLMDYFKSKNAENINFKIKIYGDDDCKIIINSSSVPYSNSAEVVKISDIQQPNSSFNIGGGQLYFNAVINTIYTQEFNGIYKIKRIIFKLYKIVTPYIFYAGIFSYLVTIFIIGFLRSRISSLYLIITLIWILLITRSTILVLVDISSFPGLTPLYFGPGFLLLDLASFLSIYYFGKLIYQKFRIDS